jgi:hypothetical protein
MKRNRLGQFAPRVKRAERRHSNPESPSGSLRVTDAEIRRRVLSEASTERGHAGVAIMHQRQAILVAENGWTGWEDYHNRMAEGHRNISRALAAVKRARR